MTNLVELEGKISGYISRVSGQDNSESDFILESAGSFQIICDSRIADLYTDGDRVTIHGKLCENGGDVYIRATDIVPDEQIEFHFT